MGSILAIVFFNLLVSTFASSVPKGSKLVSSVETLYGDVYDCVDEHKQNSLAHDHEVEISKKRCTQGAVPIRGTTLNDQKKMKINPQEFSGGVDFAGIVTAEPAKKYYGVEAVINIQNPIVPTDDEYSSAIISLEAGKGSNFNQIEVGWTVHPNKFGGDRRTRLYASWTRDNYKHTGCLNTNCAGFVTTTTEFPLGSVFPNISVRGGQQFEVRLNITLDPTHGWWLLKDDVWVGLWPVSLFTGLQSHADRIRFGGKVWTPNGTIDSPAMGSGILKDGPPNQSCYMRRLVVIDETKQPIDVNKDFVYAVDSRCYLARDSSFKGEPNRYSFNFGGPGGRDREICV